MRKEIIDDFIISFRNVDYVNKDELHDFFSSYYEKLSNSSFLWRTFELKEKGIITKISNTKYQINTEQRKKSFSIQVNDDLVSHTIMKFNQPLDNEHSFSIDEKMICIWRLNVLNAFSSHQYSKEIVFIELDKYRIGSLFFELKEKLHGDFYVTKDYSKDYDHILLEDKVIVITPLLKRSPLEKKNMMENHYVVSPKMEKILIDVFTEKEVFAMYDWSSIQEIFTNYYNKYNLDFTTLLSHAEKRGIKDRVKSFLIQALEVDLDDH